jgi:hypothetical protein
MFGLLTGLVKAYRGHGLTLLGGGKNFCYLLSIAFFFATGCLLWLKGGGASCCWWASWLDRSFCCALWSWLRIVLLFHCLLHVTTWPHIYAKRPLIKSMITESLLRQSERKQPVLNYDYSGAVVSCGVDFWRHALAGVIYNLKFKPHWPCATVTGRGRTDGPSHFAFTFLFAAFAMDHDTTVLMSRERRWCYSDHSREEAG